MPKAPAPDQAARDRITQDLGRTLFVEAGAGSGKTTALVARIVALVEGGSVEMRSIAAITFTDKAAAELRDRVRRQLEERVTQAGDAAIVSRCRTALDQLDMAAVGTLHAFAHRLLSENPIEARLPPKVEVLDEVSSGLEFERRWNTFRDALLEDATLERTILLLLATGVKHEALRVLAMAFDDNWDLVAERVPETTPEPPVVAAVLQPVFAMLRAICAEGGGCTDADDKLLARLNAIEAFAGRLDVAVDEIAALELIKDSSRPSFRVGNIGKTNAWPDLADLRKRVAEVGGELDAVSGTIATACAKRLAGAIRGFTLAAAEERRAAGRLEFHDLLVMARALLRDPAHGGAVRSRLHARYARLLLDEFQDTDTIQIDLAVRIAAAVPGDPASATGRWDEVEVSDGHLFVVGDPKQSIYRFRRADISTFIAARQRLGVDAGDVVELSANFRTVAPVIEWVNHTFAALFGEPAALDMPVASQPSYVALQPVRGIPPVGPPVSVLGRGAQGLSADGLRAAEAADVVAAIQTALADGWSVGTDDEGGGWRPARVGDITILVPARTSLPFLEDALVDAAIPYRAESSSLVYSTRTVRDLFMVLRAADDPTNSLHIVSALRTPLLACGDDDLFRFKVERQGHWSYLGDQPAGVPEDDPVRLGLAFIRSIHDESRWLAPSELLSRIAVERRAFELGFADGRPRDVWRRIRFVIDQARGWSEATYGSLREYLQWVILQTAEGARVAEAVLPETDDDAVRIMTIHAAKGLEFPITIVSGMSSRPMTQRAAAQVVFPPHGEVGYRFGKHVETEEFTQWKPIDEQMGLDERKRLLYVACTRAKDHLVVSCHRKGRSSDSLASSRTNAELLVDGMGDVLATVPDAASVAPVVRRMAAPDGPAAPPPFAEWQAERATALRRASLPTAVAASALKAAATAAPAPDLGVDIDLAAGLQKRPRDLDLPPWLKGRYGTSVGRAVHGVLQGVDLATGDGLDAAVASQCEAEAIPDRAAVVRELTMAALDSDTVRSAAAAPHWREVYVCTPVDGGRLLEGYIDLLYRSANGLMVVDYKTAGSSSPAVLDERVDGYRLQGAAYALAVAAATGEPVAGVRFLFLTPDGAVERDLDDLDDTIARVRSLVAAGEEVLVTESV